MKSWTDDELLSSSDVPEEVLNLGLDVMHWLATAFPRPAPRLVRLATTGDEPGDEWRWELDLQLAEGLNITVESGYLELLEMMDDEPEETELEGVMRDAAEALSACMPRIEALADVVHEGRVRARKMIGGWQAAGIPVRLVDVRLAPYDHWRGALDPDLHVLIEGFDERLTPSVVVVPVGKLEKLGAELELERGAIERAAAARVRLARLGASGTVDQVAINALTHFGDVAEGLRRLATEARYWLPDDTAILMRDGHVSAGSGDLDAQVQWTGDRMSVASTYMPAERLRAAVGRPVAELFDHPFASPDMIVSEASCSLASGTPTLEVRYTLVKRLFCIDSGRVWDLPESGLDTDKDGSGNVVPFPRPRTAA